MLSDELSNKAIALSVKSLDISMEIIKKAINSYLQEIKKISEQSPQGYQSLKTLNSQNHALQDIPLSNKDLRLFKRELNSYGVDYAVKKDLSQPGTFKIYFKGKDAGQIENALKDHLAKQFSKDSKPSLKERMKQAIEKSASLKKELPKDKTKNLSVSI